MAFSLFKKKKTELNLKVPKSKTSTKKATKTVAKKPSGKRKVIVGFFRELNLPNMLWIF